MSDQSRNHTPRFIVNISLLANPRPAEDGIPADPLELHKDIWIELENGNIKRLGPEGEPVPEGADDKDFFDASGCLVSPGLIDSHTHPVFFNFRQSEFVRRCQGQGYLEIAAAGGGILSSVRGVRSSTVLELADLTRSRFQRFMELGVTSLEAKSGYGLCLDAELKSLKAIKIAAGNLYEVSSTLLGAHTVPPEFKQTPDKYVDLVCEAMIPEAAALKLADAVDIFVEETAFSIEHARRVFVAAKRAGLGLRIHADQFTSSGGARLAAEFGALSADHMDCTPVDELKLLADAGVTVVLLPGAVFFLGLDRYADARRMIDAGCKIAVSTDFNPGTSPTPSLPLMMTLACNRLKLSPAEALWSVTMGGANALGKADRIGQISVGYQADLALWNAPDVDFLPYAYGDQIPAAVFKRGKLVAQHGRLLDDGVS